MVAMLSRADGGGVRGCVAVPIRHWKTWTLEAACSWWLRRNPKLRIIYMSYSINRAQEIGKDIRDVCRRTGVKIAKDHDTIALWRTEEGGGVSIMSAQQSRLGADVDILLVDDPYESGAECDKPEIREAVDGTIAHYTMRLSPGGSCILVMSRWRPDDAVGVRRLRSQESWEYVHDRAIEVVDVEGELTERAFAPDVRSLEWLKEQRAVLAEVDPTERMWFAQWQGDPIDISGEDDFTAPKRYAMLPEWPGFVDAIGLDMAYSSGKRADWFALVVVRRMAGQMFIRDVQRFRANEGVAENALRQARDVYGITTQIYSYMSGPEIGAAHYLASRGLHVNVLPARFNKRIRARKTVNRVKSGDLLVPQHAPWVQAFERRLLAWRGAEGDEDDEIDALVSVHDGMFGSGSGEAGAKGIGHRRM
jgi:predicted phage terminase large subunit-like protein